MRNPLRAADEVQVETDGRVRVIRINRPEARNAINQAVRLALAEAWQQFAADEDVWVAILTGTGSAAFCAGADLKELDPAQRLAEPGERPAFGYITRGFVTDKPMIAALNGHAIGGGLEMALACDVRIAAEHSRLGLTEARWALLPGGGGTQRLPRAIPRAVALEMMFTGRQIDANRAYQLGLVNAVTSSAELMSTAMGWAREICANGPLAVRAAKRAVRLGMETDLESGLAIESTLSREVFASADASEGKLAFAEKRPPSYRGR